MSGKVKIHESSPESYEKHDHVTIKTNNGYITYNDARRFGLITYCESDKICQHKLFANDKAPDNDGYTPHRFSS